MWHSLNPFQLLDKSWSLYFSGRGLSLASNRMTLSNSSIGSPRFIAIYTKDNHLVGYVPEADSAIFARLMDAGKMLFANVKSKNHGTSVPLIDIDIYLQDF